MENNNNGIIIDESSQKGLLLVNELVEGRDLTKQLYLILLDNASSSSSSQNDESNCLNVAQKILSKIESSLTFLMRHDDQLEKGNGSPKSSCSQENFNIKDSTQCKVVLGKRKAVPRHTYKVEGCPKSGLEGPIEDGLSWRKYGQKDIHRAKYPRAYFRCTQRGEGCIATKQVQRNEHDPTYFQVSYRSKHTCYQATSSSSPNPNPNPKPKSEPNNASPLETLWCFETNNATTRSTNNNNNNNNDNNNNNLFSSSEFLFDQGEIDHDYFNFYNTHFLT